MVAVADGADLSGSGVAVDVDADAILEAFFGYFGGSA